MDRIFVRRIFEIICRANVCAHIRMVGKIAYNGHQVGCREKRKDAEKNDIIGGGVRHWGNDIEF